MKRPSPRSADSDFLSALLHAGLDLQESFILLLLKRSDLTSSEINACFRPPNSTREDLSEDHPPNDLIIGYHAMLRRINRLKRQGLVEIHHPGGNGHSYTYRLTPAGRSLASILTTRPAP